MPLPRTVARLNRRYTNRFIEPIVRHVRGFAVVCHVGRRSGRPYRTPVVVFALDDAYLVALTYGQGADWFRNVTSGPARVTVDGVDRDVVAARLVGREVAWPVLPWFVRLALRALRVREFARLEVSPN